MNLYIAELDEKNCIAAVWVKTKDARGPRVFDPRKHSFDPETPSEFLGAPREEVVHWVAAQRRGLLISRGDPNPRKRQNDICRGQIT